MQSTVDHEEVGAVDHSIADRVPLGIQRASSSFQEIGIGRVGQTALLQAQRRYEAADGRRRSEPPLRGDGPRLIGH